MEQRHAQLAYHVTIDQSRVTVGDVITNTNGTLINKSTITGAFNQVSNDHGEALAQAFKDLASHIDQAGNQSARAHFDLLLQQLEQRTASPGILKTLWDGIVAAVVANLIQR